MDLAELDIAAMLTALTQMAQRHGIEVPSTVTTVGRALVTLEGLLDEFIPDVNMIQIISDHIAASTSKKDFVKDETKSLALESHQALHSLLAAANEMKVASRMLTRGQLRVNMEMVGSQEPIHPAGQHGEQADDGADRGRPVHRLVDCVLRGHQAGDFRHSDCRFPWLRDRVHPVRLDRVRHLLQRTRFEEAVAGRLALRVACVAARSHSCW